eukprot:5035787-Prymnesium_polylepis.2
MAPYRTAVCLVLAICHPILQPYRTRGRVGLGGSSQGCPVCPPPNRPSVIATVTFCCIHAP